MRIFNKINPLYIFLLLLIFFQFKENRTIAQTKTENQELIDQYIKQINESKAKNQLKMVAYYSNKCASVYLIEENYEKSIEFYLQSVEINTQLGDDQDNKKIYNNIAMIYSEMNQLKNSLKYFEKSLVISRRNNNKKEIAVSLMDISTILILNKQYNKAIENLNEALKISFDIDDIQNLRTCYNLLYQCYKAYGNESKAAEYYNYYLAYDKKIREGVTSLKNTDENFLSAETENLKLKDKDKEEVTTVEQENLKKKEYEISNDSFNLISNLSKQKAIELQKEILETENEIAKSRMEIALSKNQKKQLIIIVCLISIIFLSVVVLSGIYLLNKKQKYIRQLEQKIADLENNLNKT